MPRKQPWIPTIEQVRADLMASVLLKEHIYKHFDPDEEDQEKEEQDSDVLWSAKNGFSNAAASLEPCSSVE